MTLAQTYLALAVEPKSIFGECHSHARAVIHMSRQSDAKATERTVMLMSYYENYVRLRHSILFAFVASSDLV